MRHLHFTTDPRRTGDLEDILGSLPEHAFDSQAWEEYRPRTAAVAIQPGASTNGPAVPMVRQNISTHAAMHTADRSTC